MLLTICEALKFPAGLRLPFIKWRWNWLMTRIENRYIRRVRLRECGVNRAERQERVVASLTSFPARIDYVQYAVKSLMLQTVKPDVIELWLAESQFPDRELPGELLALQEYGLEICWCDKDLRGHKKYYEPMRRQDENTLLITYDDDIIYPHNSLELLLKEHEKHPKAIICNRGYEITTDADGNVNGYSRWKLLSRHGVRREVSAMHLASGSGVLYPVHALHPDVFDCDKLREYALGVDDLWVSVMAMLKHTKIVKTRYWDKTFSVVLGSQAFQLALENEAREDGVNLYDVALRRLMGEYPQLHELMRAKD